MRIAVDASALAPESGGIGRYLREILPRMIALAPRHAWTLYLRDEAHAASVLRAPGSRVAPLAASARAPADSGDVGLRADGLPSHLGRIASLVTTQPRWARRDRPDLFWGPAHRLPFPLPRTTARVVTIHDLCWREAPATMRAATRWLDRFAMPRAAAAADRVIAVSQATRRSVIEAFPACADKIDVVLEAAPEFPTPRARETLSAFGVDSRYVLFVGTPEPRKNLARLVQAFARIDGDLQLVVAGGAGWGGVDVASLARDAGIAARVVTIARFDDATLATLYAHAEGLAMPSLYEGFGLPLLEALSLGTPVLFGANSSMPEVAGDAGVGIDALEVDSIAAGLRTLLATRDALAARAKAQAANFSWDRAARETLAVLDAAFAARQARKA